MFVSQDVSSSRRNGELGLEMIEEEEVGVRIAGQSHLRRGDVGEQRQRHAIVFPAQRLAERPQEPDRALPAVAPRAADVADVHRGRPVLQHDEIHARGPDDRARPSAGRAAAAIVSARASSRHSQNSSSPRNGIRSRTGMSRRCRSAATSPRRRHACRSHSSSSTPGMASSGKYCGAPKVITEPVGTSEPRPRTSLEPQNQPRLPLPHPRRALAGLLGFLPFVGPHRHDHLELLGIGVHRHLADAAVDGELLAGILRLESAWRRAAITARRRVAYSKLNAASALLGILAEDVRIAP